MFSFISINYIFTKFQKSPKEKSWQYCGDLDQYLVPGIFFKFFMIAILLNISDCKEDT